MLSAERWELIMRVLRRGRFATVGDIAVTTKSSGATIRRDLARLEQAGLVRRVRGGAEISQPAGVGMQTLELPFQDRAELLVEKKRLIARAAASLCEDGDTIMIDGGSTTFQMAQFLADVRLQVITNSFALASALVPHSRCTVILNGGVVHGDSQLVLDPFGSEMFSNYTASKLFMGVYGIDETGATNTESLLIRTERAMIDRARDLIVLADSTKFDRRGSLFLCGFERIRAVITDDAIGERHRKMLQSAGVRLIIA